MHLFDDVNEHFSHKYNYYIFIKRKLAKSNFREMGHFVNVNAYDDVIYLNTINYFYIIPLGYAPALLS